MNPGVRSLHQRAAGRDDVGCVLLQSQMQGVIIERSSLACAFVISPLGTDIINFSICRRQTANIEYFDRSQNGELTQTKNG